MRFFIALEIPEQSKEQLSQVQAKLAGLIPHFKRTDPDKLHLTITFIGEQPDSMVAPLTEIITKSVDQIPPFSMTPAYLDGFPTLHHAKIVWVGVKGDIDKLFIIRERIKDGLVKLNLDTDERRFIPHIALGKVSNFILSPTQEMEFEKIELQKFEPIKVGSIKLFESVPDKGLHSHNTLAEIKLI